MGLRIRALDMTNSVFALLAMGECVDKDSWFISIRIIAYRELNWCGACVCLGSVLLVGRCL